MRTITLPDGRQVPALGQGTWFMGEDRSRRTHEVACLRLGIALGMTVLDTAEMYADGGAEEVVGEAIAGQRDRVYLVSKFYPRNATRQGVPAACARSLKRLRTDHLDLYLLHWRGGTPLAETVAALERLKESGQIRAWGVSNLDVGDLQELLDAPGGQACIADQVLYNLGERGIEVDLLPWCAGRGMAVMAYSPIAQGGALLGSPVLREVAARHDATPAQVALAWTLRRPGVISIPKSADPAHVRQNRAAGDLALTDEDLAALDQAFPPPQRKRPLAML